MDIISGLFAAFGLSASAGLNAYIPLLVVALLARFTELIKLNEPWDGLTSPWVIGLLVVLSIIEFFADKVPAVNHVNDLIQTLVRPAAGAVAFAAGSGVVGEVNPVFAMVMGLLVAGGVHAAKSAVFRPAVTAATGGVANTPVSILEDVISTIVSFLSVVLPILVGLVGAVFLLFMAWVLLRRRKKRAASL